MRVWERAVREAPVLVVLLVGLPVALASAASGYAQVAPELERDFELPLPLFAPSGAWNWRIRHARPLPQSEAQIETVYRVLRGDATTLTTPPSPHATPFIYVTHDNWSIPIARMGSSYATVEVSSYGTWAGTNEEKLPIVSGTVSVPAPAGAVRPAGPVGLSSDGHLVLYDAQQSLEFDYWEASTALDGEGNTLGGGYVGDVIYKAGVIDYFDTLGSGANPDGYFSARAVGTPLLAGLLVPEDVESGTIAHALAMAIPGPRNTNPECPGSCQPYESDYFYPASRTETGHFNWNPLALAAGQRIRLKEHLVDAQGDPLAEAGLAPITQMFLAALREYGTILVDNAGTLTFYAEDIHTAPLDVSNAQLRALIGAPPGAPLPPDKTRWQIAMEKLNSDLQQVPLAYGPWDPLDDPSTAIVTHFNFEVVSHSSVLLFQALHPPEEGRAAD